MRRVAIPSVALLSAAVGEPLEDRRDSLGAATDDASRVEVIRSPTDPSLSHSLELVGDWDLAYEVEVQGAPGAEYVLKRDGQVVVSGTTGREHREVFSYGTNEEIIRGEYCVVAEIPAEEVTETTCATIPLRVEVDVDALDLTVDEGAEATLDLSGRTTANPELVPLHLLDVRSDQVSDIDHTKDEVSFIAPSLSSRREDGAYELSLEFRGQDGTTHETTLAGSVSNVLDISGTLENMETGERMPGVVRVFDGKTENPLEEIEVPEDGRFDRRTGYRLSELESEHLLLQARLTDPSSGEEQCFLRTYRKPVEDIVGKRVRVYGEDGLAERDLSCENFYIYFAEALVSGDGIPSEEEPLAVNPPIKRWNLDPDADGTLLEEVVITLERPDHPVSFAREAAEEIRDRLLDPDDLGIVLSGKLTSDMVRIVEDFLTDNDDEHRYWGRVVFFPDKARDVYFRVGRKETGYIDGNGILLSVTGSGDIRDPALVAHELGHALGLEHTVSAPHEFTVMRPAVRSSLGADFRFFDRKALQGLYDETVTHGSGTLEDGRLSLQDLLGTYDPKEAGFVWLDGPE